MFGDGLSGLLKADRYSWSCGGNVDNHNEISDLKTSQLVSEVHMVHVAYAVFALP